MNAEELKNFEVELDGEKLLLKQTGPMPEKAFAYLQKHIERLNKFKTIGWWHGARSVSFFDPPLPHPAGKRGLVDRLERVFARARKPAAATLAITYDCQADCEHCSCSQNRRKQRPLNTEQWKKIITETVNLGTTNVIFTGGEPLLHKDLCELISHVDEQKATTLMFTNGELLTKERSKRLADAGLYSLFMSLDCPDPAGHDRLRRREGLYAKIMENVEHAKQAGLLVGFSIYLTHQKHENGELEQFMEIGKRAGVAEIIQFDAVPTGRLYGQMNILLTPEDREEIRQQTLAYYHKADPDYPTLTSQSLVNSPKSMGCFGAFNQFYMTAYGDMCPCDFTPITFGNAVELGVEEVWRRMTTHPLWSKRFPDCRMQSAEFRAQTVDCIPGDSAKPYSIEMVDEACGRPVINHSGE